MPSPRRIAVYLSLATEHGRGILRGIARFYHQHPEVTVLKFNDPRSYDPAVLRRLKVNGIIARVTTRRNEAALTGLGVPVVNVSGQIATPKVPLINTDDLRVGNMALRHLHSRAYRHFAYCGNSTHLGSVRRYRGYCAAARELGITMGIPRHLLPQGDQNAPYADAPRDRLTAWLKTLPRPVGILGFTDRVALELDEACARLGLRVPEDVAILGVGNDLTRVEFAHVALTSIQLNTQQIGHAAAESLQTMMNGQSLNVAETLISPLKIVTRNSTDRFAVDDEVVAIALDHMREHVGNTIYVAEVARAAGVTRRVLELRFRAAFGTSVYAEAQRLHFARAQELMAEPDLTLGEIAYASGFESPSVFASAFRRRFQVSPSAYRRVLMGPAG
ncbi:MAG: DNA-binding transcriptional regulator [Cephaloticoccus sp.]|nr:DNA-binding transcriptional regulator [Cephaloticoccus sp.]MCF7759514.1 DNA-binding transcriptional regulator [Cephaloticoccus sp.]